LCALHATALADEVATLAVRGQVTQSYLLMPATADAPKAVALLFPGGNGLIRLPRDGSLPNYGPRGNFLVRTREQLRDSELAVALVDAPSDRQDVGMDDAFRSSPEHANDIAAVVRDLKRRYAGARMILIGTSRGTVSAAYVARALAGEIDAVALTSSVFLSNRRHRGLSGFDFSDIKARLLFVHHKDDGCDICPYDVARRLGATYALISVRGGKPAESGPCAPLSEHGYFGREAETVAAIKAWIFGKPYPASVE